MGAIGEGTPARSGTAAFPRLSHSLSMRRGSRGSIAVELLGLQKKPQGKAGPARSSTTAAKRTNATERARSMNAGLVRCCWTRVIMIAYNLLLEGCCLASVRCPIPNTRAMPQSRGTQNQQLTR